MHYFQLIRAVLLRKIKRRRYSHIYRQYSEFTMIPRETFVDNLMLAQRVLDVKGCVVECGVWRGGMTAGLATVLGTDRHYFLFDSFEGLPTARPIDGFAALRWQQAKESPGYHDNCTAGEEFARRAMMTSGAKSFRLISGWFEKTLPNFSPPEPIALLRLDADWYDSTMMCLDSLFDRVAAGGLIVLDDYYAWDGCSRALHDFLSRRSAIERIRNFGDVCYLQKADVMRELEAQSPEH